MHDFHLSFIAAPTISEKWFCRVLEAPSETVVGCYNTLAFSPIAGRYLGFTFFVALHDERTLIR